mgnify:CR=1 FL=1
MQNRRREEVGLCRIGFYKTMKSRRKSVDATKIFLERLSQLQSRNAELEVRVKELEQAGWRALYRLDDLDGGQPAEDLREVLTKTLGVK